MKWKKVRRAAGNVFLGIAKRRQMKSRTAHSAAAAVNPLFSTPPQKR